MSGFVEELVFGLDQQPRATEHDVKGGQCKGNQHREGNADRIAGESSDVSTEHPALRHGRHERSKREKFIPHGLSVIGRFHPEVKGSAAQNKPNQHDGDRNIKGGEDNAMGFRERNQQHTYAHYDPGFVGIPERTDGGNHHVFLSIGAEGQQHANPQIKTIKNHIQQQR